MAETEILPVGELMQRKIYSMDLPQVEIAWRMRISDKHMSNLVRGKCKLSAEMAMRFEYVTGMSADVLMQHQAAQQVAVARRMFNGTLEAKEEAST